MTDSIDISLRKLRDVIASHGPMTIAYSGGVDSGLLAAVAHEVLGTEMVCVLGVSPSLSSREERDAIAFLEERGIPLRRVHPGEADDERYRENTRRRCYFCKEALFDAIDALPAEERFPVVAYGANLDDLGDHRPGAQSANGRGVVAPLVEAEFDKAMVRAAARHMGLRVWDKPAAPCLASRIPYGTSVTRERLAQVERAEEALRRRGFSDCRVRHYGSTARIELPLEAHARATAPATWSEIVGEIRGAGFSEVELLGDGLRSGRLND